LGMATLTDTLRTSGYGVPPGDASKWITWVGGMKTNPVVSGSGKDTKVFVASCVSDLATFNTRANANATTIKLTPSVSGQALTSLFDTSKKKLITIDGQESAIVTAVTTTQLTIDTSPITGGGQGLSQSYPIGTPVCRVDVRTFSIQADPTTKLLGLGAD